MTSDKSYIGDRLRRFLQLRGWTIRSLADRTGIPYRTLQDYLANKNRPGTAHLSAMAGAGVDLNWLLGKERVGIPRELGHFAAAPEPLRGDRALLEELSRRVMAAVDETNSDHVQKHGTSMPLIVLVSTYARGWDIAMKTAGEMASIIEDLSKRGVPPETIADVICGSLPKVLAETGPEFQT